MRILAISDTHGRKEETFEVIQKLGACDLLVHLGDGAADIEKCRSYINADILQIKGNNDFGDYPFKHILRAGGHNIFCAHGHMLGVKQTLEMLACEAKKCGCDIALYGHTHTVSDDTVSDVRLLNPGSIGYPYGKRGAVEIIDNNGEFSVKIIIL